MNPVYILNLAKEIVYWNSLQNYNTINEEQRNMHKVNAKYWFDRTKPCRVANLNAIFMKSNYYPVK